MIELRNFSNKQLYQQMNLKITQGEIVGLYGANGSGKTSLLYYLLGIYNDYDGEILINNILLDDSNFQELRKQISIMWHNPFEQFIGTEVIDDLVFKMEQNNLSTELIEAKLTTIPQELLAEVELSTQISNLSGGQAQIVQFISNILNKEKIIIFDEALSNISQKYKQIILRKLKEMNLTCLLISNNLGDLSECEKVYQLIDKQIICRTMQTNPLKEVNLTVNKAVDGYVDILSSGKKVEFNKGINLLIGENGIGKSYFLQKAFLENQNIGFVPQYVNLLLSYESIAEMIIKNKLSEEEFWQQLKTFRLSQIDLTKDLSLFSTGELVIIYTVLMILKGYEIILFDESLEVISDENKQILLDKLVALKKDCIFVTHNPVLFSAYPTSVYELLESKEVVMRNV